MKNHKASGIDNINAELLNYAGDAVEHGLLDIIQTVLWKGEKYQRTDGEHNILWNHVAKYSFIRPFPLYSLTEDKNRTVLGMSKEQRIQ